MMSTSATIRSASSLSAVAQPAPHRALDVEHGHARCRTHRQARTRDLHDPRRDEQVDVLLLERPAQPTQRLAVHLGVARDGHGFDAVPFDDADRVVLATQHRHPGASEVVHGRVVRVADAGADDLHARGARIAADAVGQVADGAHVAHEQRRLEAGTLGAPARDGPAQPPACRECSARASAAPPGPRRLWRTARGRRRRCTPARRRGSPRSGRSPGTPRCPPRRSGWHRRPGRPAWPPTHRSGGGSWPTARRRRPHGQRPRRRSTARRTTPWPGCPPARRRHRRRRR